MLLSIVTLNKTVNTGRVPLEQPGIKCLAQWCNAYRIILEEFEPTNLSDTSPEIQLLLGHTTHIDQAQWSVTHWIFLLQ